MNRGSMAFFFGMLFCFTSLSGQNTQDTILAYFNLLEKVPQEKLYLHLDKPFYGAACALGGVYQQKLLLLRQGIFPVIIL